MAVNNNSSKSGSKLSRRGFVQTAALGVAGLAATAQAQTKDQHVEDMITSGRIDKRLEELGISLPEFAPPVATYASYRIVGDMVYISGIGPAPVEGAKLLGALGKDLSVEEGAFAAERTILNVISQAKAACGGNLDRIAQWVRLTGYVHSADNFIQQPQVMNGASELLVKIFGEKGLHARAALGMNTLPFNIAVEIEASFQLRS
ncbi:MAG: RidA family protein [Proteobacteria bacterium]|nr:RidA family protein [Pseudomonadota bacterium]